MAGFTPLHNRVLIKQDDAETKTPGGILIVDNAQEKPNQGIVIAVGKGRPTDDGKIVPMSVKPGDRVMYGKYDGAEIQIEGVTHIIMAEDQIVGVFS